LLWRSFEISVVISAADYAVLEGLLAEPLIEGQNLLYVVPRVHKVASMNQNVSVR
jgi:hypothetical protein